MSETYIYQIGEVVLDIERNVLPSYYSTETDFEIQNVQSPFLKVINASQYRLNNTELSVSGGIKYETAISRFTTELDQKLRSYQGIVVHVFACIISDFLENDCDNKQIWVYTTAMIKNVQLSRGSNYATPTIEVGFTLLDYWKCIDTNLFCFGDDFGNELDLIEPPLTYSPEAYPTFEIAVSQKNQWKKKNFSNYDFIYNPEYWNSLYCDDCLCNGCGSVLYYSNPNKWREVQTDEYVFGYAPISIYSIYNLNQNTTIEITTISKQEFRNITRVTTIDCSVINDQIVELGYTPLTSGDILVFGDVKRYHNNKFYRPAFVFRNSEILENVFPVISYDDEYPAMINSGKSRIYIGSSNSDIKVAWVHQFRRI
jgi:hypothetical protein